MKNLRVALSISAVVLLTIGRSDVHANPGDLYSGQLSHNEIDKFSPTGVETLFISGFFADALAFDSKGNLFVADTQTGKIVKVTPGGVATDFATIGNPMGLAFDASGNLFVSNASSGSTGSIIKLTPAGASSTFVTGLSGPSGLAFDRNGNLFVSETTAGIISKFTPAKVKTTFASGLSSPEGLAFDSAGNLYETDFGSGNVFKFTPAKTKSAFASPRLTGLGPRNIAIDRNDNVFVANFTPQTIVKFTPAGGTPTTFASNANAGGLAFEPATAQLTNISTRASVQAGSGVTIAGFIITGTDSKQVVVRGLGPTLTQFGVSGVLADPTLDLHNSTSSITTNDNWKDTQQTAIQATGLAPPNDLESAILITLQPGNYTAILAGKNNTTGVGLVEMYDISSGVFAELTNVSTRGHVGLGDDVMIGGFIAGGGNGSIEIVVRGLGPTLTQFGVAGALSDPKLTLLDVNGNVVRSNNNWKDTQQAAIQATGLAPPNNVESALVVTVAAGNYTAILEGSNGGTGIGLVEIYKVP